MLKKTMLISSAALMLTLANINHASSDRGSGNNDCRHACFSIYNTCLDSCNVIQTSLDEMNTACKLACAYKKSTNSNTCINEVCIKSTTLPTCDSICKAAQDTCLGACGKFYNDTKNNCN